MALETEGRLRAARVRRRVLDLSYRAHVGHIGSCLCVADLMAGISVQPRLCLGTDSMDRDRFVLAKGHAALAWYATLEDRGVIDPSALERFGSDGSPFGVHPERANPGIDFSSGSLGQGLGIAVGSALAARVRGQERATLALMSDAECNSGATWEAVMFAGHHALGGLVGVIDANGQQALGATQRILDLEPLGAHFDALGWLVREIDGHDMTAILEAVVPDEERPVAVIARTVFGKGVSFMEGRLEWHYLPMTEQQYERAIADVGSVRA